jgi:FdhD protein
VRQLRGHTSCGICGVEEIAQVAQGAQAMPSLRNATAPPRLDAAPIRRALAELRDYQPLSRVTRCAHAAAWSDPHGRLVLVREDVGRHNALDKLIGGCLHDAVDTSDGFCLVTSRCSFEMVQKAVAARMSALVAISAPTALAVRTARQAGLTLAALDRGGEPVVYSGSDWSGEP